MKIVTGHRPVFQGDVMFVRVNALPSDAKPTGDNVVAHSETGHHHVAERAIVFTRGDAMELFIQAVPAAKAGRARKAKALIEDAFVDIVHKRNFDTHETIRLLGEPGAVWRVRRQREHTPEGWAMVRD